MTSIRMQPQTGISKSTATVRVQSIFYRLEYANIERSLEYLNNASKNAMAAGVLGSVEVAFGDCSPEPILNEEKIGKLRAANSFLSIVRYDFFNKNLGSAAGHNRLLNEAHSDYTMILNPDVLVFPNIFTELMVALARPGVGLVEARQSPIEHPKDYDPATGQTSWASTACAIARTSLFRQLQGFDAENFFLYCDDVDFSWRVRLAGHQVIHQSSAVVLHDKRLNHQGGWIASEAEQYYSAEAALLLTFKYSRPDLTEAILKSFRQSGSSAHIKAAAAIDGRMATGQMPQPIDGDHAVAQFIDGAYAVHRFAAH